jgi:biopolymer transport protein ExbD
MSAPDFSPPPRKAMRESVVPMINVVFLLLIFFLMSAQIAPPDPIEITPPIVTRLDQPLTDSARMAFLGRDGVLIHEGLIGAEALEALAAQPGPVLLRADAELGAGAFATVLRDLAQAGISEVTLAAIAGTE